MQRIMVVSDTHGRLENLAEALSREGKLDMLIHLGDFEGDDEVICEMANCKVLMVPGNNDFFSTLNREIETQIGKYHVLLTHGHYYYVSLDLKTLHDEGIARGFDIVMFGHTHRPVINAGDVITMINPGSLSYPRQQDKKSTYIMMEVDSKENINFYLKAVE